MENYVENLIEKVVDKLGPAAGLIANLGDEIRVSLEAGDIDGLRGRIQEAREASEALTNLCDHFDRALEDGSLSATEIGGGALLLNEFLDEAEDVATGVDEDDLESVGR